MLIRSTILIALLGVGVAGCQHNRGKATPITTASLSDSSNASEIPAPIPTGADMPAPVPHVTASAPSVVAPYPDTQVAEHELKALTVQPYPDTPVPAPEEIPVVAPSVEAPEQAQKAGRTYKWGRQVIASRGNAKTQRIIVEDDLTPDNYELDSGDRIRLSVFEQRNLSRIYTIDSGGYISVPLVGNISVRGQTTSGLEAIIAERLSKKYIKDPKVSVEINTYRPFYILGQVRNSGGFPFVNGMTVRTAVAVAGGYTARANKRKVLLTRRLNSKRITTYVQPDYYIRPGDTLEIRERFF